MEMTVKKSFTTEIPTIDTGAMCRGGEFILDSLTVKVSVELLTAANLVGRTFRIVGVKEKTRAEINNGARWALEMEELVEA